MKQLVKHVQEEDSAYMEMEFVDEASDLIRDGLYWWFYDEDEAIGGLASLLSETFSPCCVQVSRTNVKKILELASSIRASDTEVQSDQEKLFVDLALDAGLEDLFPAKSD